MIDLSSYIRRGDGVWWGQAAAEPTPLVDALLDQADSIRDLHAFCGLSWNERLRDPLPDSLLLSSYGAFGVLRAQSRAGRLNVVPCRFSALPRLFAQHVFPNDVGLVQVSPPDDDGYVTLGVGVDWVADAVMHTRTVVAEVNRQMPATIGGPRLPISTFAAVIETDRPLPIAPVRPAAESDRTIAASAASLVENGDTVQVGLGALALSVLESLSGHAELGVHSGMITDSVLDLVDKGVVTGARKEIDPGLIVTGTALGSGRLYGRIESYPVELRATSYTHDPSVLSSLRSLVSVNSAIEVDLLGQVNSEVRDGVYVGAVGGQADFSRAAALTGARSIIVLRSTTSGRSTIVPRLGDAVVTTERADVDYVVTEHGVARLTGCGVAERARRLIEVAAPADREDLERFLTEPGS